MSAKIIIRGRSEPIFIDEGRAKKLKARRFGTDGEAMADPKDLVDLGEWCGEYGRIVEIEINPKEKKRDTAAVDDAREKAEAEVWLKMSAEDKAKKLGYFKLCWVNRTGLFGQQPPDELLKRAEKMQLKFYTEHPEALRPTSDDYGDLLPPKTGEPLSEQMKVGASKPNGKNCVCGKPLIGTQRYCSGQCMLDDKNGKISTE